LSKGKGQCGPNLQDAEPIPDEFLIGARHLVVAGMCFQDQLRMMLKKALEMMSLRRVVVDDGVVIEFDARLHHHTDNAFPCCIQSGTMKSSSMHLDRVFHCLSGSYLKHIKRMVSPARCRDFRPDDIEDQP